VWSKAFGHSDRGTQTAATPQTLYRIGSITKTFTATAILQLHEEGKLRLDDRVSEHVKTAAPVARRLGLLEVTLRELLTHSSGLQRDLPGTWWTRPAFPAHFPDSFDAIHGSGTQWKYSNVGYALLGEVVAAASGEPWARYVARRILDPLGMTGTIALPHRDEPRLATGYSRPSPADPHVPAPRMDHGAASPAASIASTLDDIARYLVFHMGSGAAVLGAKSLREMHRVQWLLDDWQNGWSLGMRVRRADGQVRVGHPGTAPGFAAVMEFIPALKLGVAVLTNADDGNPALFCDYALQLLSPIVAKAAARPAPLLAEDAERCCGRYRSENGNLSMLVAVLDGQLVAVPPGAPNPYAARMVLERTSEPDTFVMRSGGAFSTLPFGERFAFTTDVAGKVTGYVTSGARYFREQPLLAIERSYIRSGIDRRQSPQAPYGGVERRAGADRRGLSVH
jgi:CubicO group peptidase (beta-lactamase class C family)